MYFGRCLVTGGTGWLGRYVVAALRANENVVTALDRTPHFEGRFDAIIHVAPVEIDPYLALAVGWDRCPVLLLSSGAVVKKSDDYLNGYARAKQANESAVHRYDNGRIARVYSVLGPGIPLDAHYAASSFLSQATSGGPVVVHDGAVRSYLHPKDVASALLTILAHGDGEPYDVGGEVPMLVSSLGRRIAEAADVPWVTDWPLKTDAYLPDLTRLHALGWKQTIGLDAMIDETLESLRVRA